MPMKVEIDNVEEVLNRIVQKQGKLSGLSDFEGKKVKVLILDGNTSSGKKGRETG